MARDDSSRPSLACEDEARHQEILAAIKDIAAAIRERRDADKNVVDDGERCKRCGLYEWNCDCDIAPVEPYECPECSHKEYETHAMWCVHEGLVTVSPVRDSFPMVSTQRGGIRFTDSRLVVGDPWWKGMLPGEEIIKTPGAPPPPRPDGIQFDVIREPEFKEGDTIRVVTPEGERTFIVGEVEPEPEPEPLSPHWAWVASFDAGKPHPYLIGTGDEGFCNVCGLRTSMLHTVYNAMESLKKLSPQRLTHRSE